MAQITFPEGFDKNCTSDRQRASKMLGIAVREIKKGVKTGDFTKEDLKPFYELIVEDFELTTEVATQLIEQHFTIV